MDDPMLSTVIRNSRAVKDSVWVVINGLAAKHQAVNLGQGFPDSEGNPVAKQAASEALMGAENQYAPPIGHPLLRQALARKYERQYGLKVDPDTEVTVTVGASEGLYVILSSLLNPGDEVITFQPFFDLYIPPVEFNAAKMRACTLHAPDFGFDRGELAGLFNDRTKAILLNTPHNPTGKVFSRDDLDYIASLCKKHDVLCITDEVYEHLAFDGRKHIPMATLPGMYERTLTLSSAGKTLSLTGWKVGWVVGPPDLQKLVRLRKQYVSFAGARPLQVGVGAAFDKLGDDFYADLIADYQEKRDYLVRELASMGLKPHVPEGGYFVMVDITPTGFTDSTEFAKHLIEKCGVAVIPPSVFYLDDDEHLSQSMVRIAICKSWDTLKAGMERMRKGNLVEQQQ